MTEQNNHENDVKIEFTGGRFQQRYYRGDGLMFDLESPGSLIQSVPESKAAQLLKKFPDKFKLADGETLDAKVSKSIESYQNRMITAAEENKSDAGDPAEIDWSKPEWSWKTEWMSRYLTEKGIDHNPNSKKTVIWKLIKKTIGAKK